MTNLEIYAEAITAYIEANPRKKWLKPLKTRCSMELARFGASWLQVALGTFNPVTNTISKLGRDVLAGSGEYATSLDEKNRNFAAAKIGWSLLNVLATDLKVIDVSRGSKGRDKYLYRIADEQFVEQLFASLDELEETAKPVFVEPQFEQPEPFTRFWHPVAGPMARNTHPKAYREFGTRKTPKVFETINKLQSNKYGINLDLLDVYKQIQGDDVFTFADKLIDEKQLESKMREQQVILSKAEKVGERAFYQYMFYDWRGRVYSSTSYLNHTGHKLAKSLIQYHDKKPINAEGYFFLLVHAANCWGFDKADIDGRYDFADSKLDVWMEIASDPVKNKLWQAADSPFEFLAAIMEIKKSHQHNGGPYDYASGLLVAWDATCSGLQVLGALARDRHSAELSNISLNDKRGDYYKMIADHVWAQTTYTDQELKAFEKLQEGLLELKENLKNAKGRKASKEAWEKLLEYQKAHSESMTALAKVFWGRPEIAKQRRSIAKRPCMTYFYSCGPNTMAEAIYDDHSSDAEFAGIDSRYTFWLAVKIHKACRELMPKPTELMKLFVSMGVKDYSNGLDFSLVAPSTGFPMMQHYREDSSEKLEVEYRGKRLQLRVMVGQKDKFDLERVKSGSSPNVVHMLDGALMAVITMTADYPVTCVHDSFAASVGDANKLYEDTRQSFVDLFSAEVLEDLIAQKDMDVQFDYGDLNVEEAIQNEHCFS